MSNLRSPADAIVERNIFKREPNKNWAMQREVPHSVLEQRAREESKQEIRAIRDAHNATVKLGVFAQPVENGFKVLGFGVTVATEDAVREIAVRNNRHFYKIGERQVNI